LTSIIAEVSCGIWGEGEELALSPRKRRLMVKQALKEMQKDTETIAGPGKNTKKTFSVKFGKEKLALEEFCNYKSMLVLENLGELSEQIDLAPIIAVLMAAGDEGATRGDWAAVAVRVLPSALKQAPRMITKLAALSLISNKKLSELYDEPNGIADEIHRVGKLIDFQGKPGLPLEIITEALPYIGLDALKNGLTGLGEVLSQRLGSSEQTPNAG